jgi:transposase-like protein
MVTDGLNLRRAARLLQVQHTTILHWKRQAAQRLSDTPPQPQVVHQVELDAVYTFVGEKKNGITS